MSGHNNVDLMLMQRVASLRNHEIDDEQICAALGMTQDELDLLVKAPEFEKELRARHIEKVEQAVDITDGLDTLETMAIQKLLGELNKPFLNNPDFALRVAAFANKAQRPTRTKGAGNRGILDATRAGPVVLITLNTRFVEALSASQSETNIIERDHQRIPQKRKVNLPTPKQVEGVFSKSKGTSAELELSAEDITMDAFEEVFTLNNKG